MQIDIREVNSRHHRVQLLLLCHLLLQLVLQGSRSCLLNYSLSSIIYLYVLIASSNISSATCTSPKPYSYQLPACISLLPYTLTFCMSLKALAHYTQNCKKCSYLPYTLQLFLTTATFFPAVFYMSNDFLTNFFRKIFAVSYVVCKGLYA